MVIVVVNSVICVATAAAAAIAAVAADVDATNFHY